ERGSIRPIVRRFFRDLHVVHVRFTHAGRSDFNELGLAAHFLNGLAAAIAHGGPDAAYQLIDDGDDAALVGHAAFDAFGHELVSVVGRVLEVAVGRAVAHGAHAAHAAI